jgi:hypothetical protein
MIVETSVNLSSALVDLLKKTAAHLGISVSRLVTVLLNKVTMDDTLVVMFSRVRYQKRDPGDTWRQLHLYLRKDAYEGGLDLRKVRKLSVSFVIALAVKQYLKDIILEYKQNKSTDNSTPPYIFISKTFDGIQYFLIIRGIPRKKHLQNLLL